MEAVTFCVIVLATACASYKKTAKWGAMWIIKVHYRNSKCVLLSV